MRTVLHVTDSASRLAGGMFESVRGLCKGVDSTGAWSASVVAQEDAFSTDDRAVWGETPVFYVPRSWLGPIGPARRMSDMISARAPDIVHLHGVWGPASLALRLLLDNNASPCLVVSPRGMFEPWALARSRWKKAVAWRAWMQRIVGHADCLHALCEEEYTSLRRLTPKMPIAVIPNGVDLPAGPDGPSRPRQRTILFLGRLHPKKGLAILLDAWATLSQARAEGWQLVIAGWDDGGFEACLRSQAVRLGLGESVVFHGPAFGAAKAQLFRTASVFVLPSFSEGLPMAVLESWSYSTPVLMTDECHLDEGFAADAALRVEPTPESLAAGLARIVNGMSEADRSAMGARGRALVREQFTWSQIGSDMALLYDRLLGGSWQSCAFPQSYDAPRPLSMRDF